MFWISADSVLRCGYSYPAFVDPDNDETSVTPDKPLDEEVSETSESKDAIDNPDRETVSESSCWPVEPRELCDESDDAASDADRETVSELEAYWREMMKNEFWVC